MQAKLQCIEWLAGYDELAIKNVAANRHRLACIRHFREIALERALAAGLEMYNVLVPKGDAAETIVFRLEKPAWSIREFINRLGLHRLKREGHLESHSGGYSAVAVRVRNIPQPRIDKTGSPRWFLASQRV